MKSTNNIFLEMKNELEASSGTVVHEGGDMYLRLYAIATEIASLWAQVDWTRMQSFPQTATGDYLDRHAFARGLERGKSSKATGVIRFEVDTASIDPILVPRETVCQTASGAEFITEDDAEILPGELYCNSLAVARESGKIGNVKAGNIRFMALAPAGVIRCNNTENFVGGADVEDDISLRERIMVSFASLPNGSNRAYYESAVLDIDGVVAACAVSCPRGIGTVDVIIASEEGIPSPQLLSTVYARLSEEREICVDLKVLAPKPVTVNVNVEIDIEDTATFETVKKQLEAAILDYFDGRLLSKNVLLAQLGNVVFHVPGVLNYAIKSPSCDIEIGQDGLPVAGTISVVGR